MRNEKEPGIEPRFIPGSLLTSNLTSVDSFRLLFVIFLPDLYKVHHRGYHSESGAEEREKHYGSEFLIQPNAENRRQSHFHSD